MLAHRKPPRNGKCFLSVLLLFGSDPDRFCHQPEDIWRHEDGNHSVYFYALDLPCIVVSVVVSQILAPRTPYGHK